MTGLYLQLHGTYVEVPDYVLPSLDKYKEVLLSIKQKKYRPARNIEWLKMNCWS